MLDWVLCNRGWEVGDGGGDGGPIDVEEAYYVCRNSHNGLSSRLFRLSGEDLGGFGNDGPREGLGGMFV